MSAAVSTATAARSAARRRLEGFLQQQLQAVNNGDVRALSALLNGSASWRVPRFDGGSHSSSKNGAVTRSRGTNSDLGTRLEEWAGRVTDTNALATQVILDEDRRSAAVEWVLRYRLLDDSNNSR